MQSDVVSSLQDVSPAEWDALAGTDNPFVRHAFLLALERSGCTQPDTGWSPHHLLVRVSAPGGARHLVGAAPMYLKSHSYGEYVFDWAWADAYARAGLRYYPKLVAAVPFTPVTGPRLLVKTGTEREAVADRLVGDARELAGEVAASSLHFLFASEDDARRLEAHGFLRRLGYQFHWRNAGYASFDDYLAGFTSHRRKNVRRERRQVREAGVHMEVMTGTELGARHWDLFYDFYHATVRKHGAIPYLTRAFFHELGRTMPENIVLILARHHGDYVGASLNLRGGDALYGRYWGGHEGFPSLHFETCYYRPIEYCIARGIKRFEAGAQGEHKLARGLLPAATHSAHWLSHAAFGRAVADFLQRERGGLEYHMSELNAHAPFKKE